MIVNNNFRMKAIFIGGIVGLITALGANHLLPNNKTQSQPSSTGTKIEKKIPAFVASSGNYLLNLKAIIFKAASDAQEFVHTIGRNKHIDQVDNTHFLQSYPENSSVKRRLAEAVEYIDKNVSDEAPIGNDRLQMILMNAFAKNIKKESTSDISHTGLANEPPLALKGTLRLATPAEVLYIEGKKLMEEMSSAMNDFLFGKEAIKVGNK